jgi:hypothetical protein
MPLSTTSMVTSNDSLNHLFLGFVVGTLLLTFVLCLIQFEKGHSPYLFFVHLAPHFVSYEGR